MATGITKRKFGLMRCEGAASDEWLMASRKALTPAVITIDHSPGLFSSYSPLAIYYLLPASQSKKTAGLVSGSWVLISTCKLKWCVLLSIIYYFFALNVGLYFSVNKIP